MQVQKITSQDYDILHSFWKTWKFPPPPPEFLPDNGLGGLKIVMNGEIVCAGFLYETNSKVAWLEFVVSNPNIKDRDLRHKALVDLIRYLTVQAEMKGYKYVFSSLRNPSLTDKFKEVGYSASKPNHTEVVIKL